MFREKKLFVSIFLSGVTYRYYQHDGYETSYDCIKSDLSWAWARVPNASELVGFSWPLAVVNVLVEPFVERLYQTNPVAKAVIRDWTKVPSTVVSWWNADEVGGTHIKYDEGSVYGSIAKVGCKSAVIATYAIWHPDSSIGALEGASRVSNYLCEPLTRVFGLISQERQAHNETHMGYFGYAKAHIDKELILQALFEGLTKTAAADQMGNFFGSLGLFSGIKTLYTGIENSYISYVLGEAQAGALLQDRLYSISTAIPDQLAKKLWMSLSLVGMDFVFKTMAEMVTTAVLSPGSRLIQDMTGTIVREGLDYFYGASEIQKEDSRVREEVEQAYMIVDDDPIYDEPAGPELQDL